MTENLKWSCHVCGNVREDKFISVYTKDLSENFNLPFGTIKQNVRYCNDNQKCKTGSMQIKFLNEPQ